MHRPTAAQSGATDAALTDATAASDPSSDAAMAEGPKPEASEIAQIGSDAPAPTAADAAEPAATESNGTDSSESPAVAASDGVANKGAAESLAAPAESPEAADATAPAPDAAAQDTTKADDTTPVDARPAEADAGNAAETTQPGTDPLATSSSDGVKMTNSSDAQAKSKDELEIPGFTPDDSDEKDETSKTSVKNAKPAKKAKKISPRQRRRRWLVGVLKPLQGKRFTSDKLSSFQLVMLGRALRSQVAECGFEYDAGKLVAELQRTAAGFNHHLEDQMRDIVLQNEASIREAAEIAWWDDVQERASARLVSITADHLRRQVNRGPVDAKVVMSIDAVGPRTAATTVVSADGRVLHTEDLPCQLSASQRGQAVARMGELIHTHHVDLIVISNGPAHRATMIALGDLIAASPEKSIRWTLADRSGADAYAGSSVSDQEMRSTPRRFRSAAWLAFSVLQPAQSMAKVDPLKLRLSSFQRELSDEALAETLEDVMISGASRGGVDANSAPQSWLRRLPGVTPEVATAIDKARRDSLFNSREAISEMANWPSAVESRQSLPFLRVFGSAETLDGTLIHPDDYSLARKLASTLELELPPASPPGYLPPDFTGGTSTEDIKPIEVVQKSVATTVEDFTASGEKSPEFAIPDDAPPSDASLSETASSDTESDAPAAESAEASEGSADEAELGGPKLGGRKFGG